MNKTLHFRFLRTAGLIYFFCEMARFIFCSSLTIFEMKSQELCLFFFRNFTCKIQHMCALIQQERRAWASLGGTWCSYLSPLTLKDGGGHNMLSAPQLFGSMIKIGRKLVKISKGFPKKLLSFNTSFYTLPKKT